jgi:hypothetical protein
MLGIQKGTVNINLFNNDSNQFENVALLTPATDDPGSLSAIYANPGKQFETTQVTFDQNVPAANVESIIQDAINTWIAANGPRYDDITVTINTSGGGTHDVMVLINRNY